MSDELVGSFEITITFKPSSAAACTAWLPVPPDPPVSLVGSSALSFDSVSDSLELASAPPVALVSLLALELSPPLLLAPPPALAPPDSTFGNVISGTPNSPV